MSQDECQLDRLHAMFINDELPGTNQSGVLFFDWMNMKILGVWVSSNNSHAWYHTGPVKTGCSFKIWSRPCMTSDNLCLHPYRVRHLIYSEVKYPKIFSKFRLRSTNFFFRHSIVPNEYCYDQKFWTQLQCSFSNYGWNLKTSAIAW